MSVQATPSTVVVEQPAADQSSAVNPGSVATQVATEPLVESDLLVEDVSIDGMCGVY
jgi:mycofactocin precursor